MQQLITIVNIVTYEKRCTHSVSIILQLLKTKLSCRMHQAVHIEFICQFCYYAFLTEFLPSFCNERSCLKGKVRPFYNSNLRPFLRAYIKYDFLLFKKIYRNFFLFV